ncbi:MAG: HYR domain-containing protein [Bacteroidetes bacterium]|nr:HYR domain-containing protein [Bacteroidota bacterium]
MRQILCLLITLAALHCTAQVPTQGLVAYFPFDNNTQDNSEYHNNGTINGGIQTTTDRNGNACGAMAFDGKTGYVSVPNNSSIQAIRSGFTVATWFKLDVPTANEARVVLFSKDSTDAIGKAEPGFHVTYLQNFNEAMGQLSFCNGYAEEDKTYGQHRLAYNEWYHIALSYDEGWLNLYLNGKRVWQAMYNQAIEKNDFALEIGRNLWPQTNYFKGSYDEYRLYNRGLNATEILALYNYTPPLADGNTLSLHMPSDITVVADEGKCSATVSYNEPTATVGCGQASIHLASGQASGSAFTVGTHTITYEAKHNNKKEAAAFNITVLDRQPPVFEYAPEVTTHTYDSAGATVHYLFGASDNCGTFKTYRTAGMAAGSKFPIGKTEVKYEAVDSFGNKSACSFMVIVIQDERPVVKETAPATVVQARPAPKAETITPKAEPKAETTTIAKTNTEPVAKANNEKPKPAPTTKATVSEKPKSEPVKPNPSPVATPTSEPTVIEVACGSDISRNTDAGKCGASIHYNVPKYKGQALKLNEGIASNSLFPVGLTRNSFSLVDVPGFVSNCHFVVKVSDKEKPVINCPKDTIIMLSYNRKGIIYNYTPPKASDNCGVDSFVQTIGSAPGCFLPIGEHPFEFIAIDAAGNKTVCGYSVSVRNSGKTEKLEIPKQLDALLNLGNDTIKYEHEGEVGNCLLTMFVYDDGEEDGDSVSIIFDGQVLVDNQKLRLKDNGPIRRQLALASGNPNYIVAKAWNTGRTGLNTMRMDIYEGDIPDEKHLRGKKPILSKILHARPGQASGIILRCNW